jgi:hypothetical protein
VDEIGRDLGQGTFGGANRAGKRLLYQFQLFSDAVKRINGSLEGG